MTSATLTITRPDVLHCTNCGESASVWPRSVVHAYPTCLPGDMQRGHVEYDLTVDGAFSDEDHKGWDCEVVAVTYRGQPWDGELSAIETARAILLLREVARK